MIDDGGSVERQVLQRLQDLRRAGLDRVPIGRVELTARPARKERPVSQSEPEAEPAPRMAPVEPTPVRVPVASSSSLFGAGTLPGEALPLAERMSRLLEVSREVASCPRCDELVATRTQTVFGEGNAGARLMFIGEAPGQTEDETGRPFVGKAGQLLTDMITKGMGLAREEVYIANILKCRPPNNRDPMPNEVKNCIGYLERQIELIRPEFLCLLGKPAAQTILETAMPMGKIRGRWYRYKGIATIATWHPAYLLRNPPAKAETWEDLKLLMKAMGLTPPKRG